MGPAKGYGDIEWRFAMLMANFPKLVPPFQSLVVVVAIGIDPSIIIEIASDQKAAME